jgi:hypothetical protein
MVDFPEGVRKIARHLDAKGVGSECPMCHKNEWALQDDMPYSRTEVTDADFFPLRVFRGFMPTYWLYCGNCGFVAQFLKSIVDDEGEPKPE